MESFENNIMAAIRESIHDRIEDEIERAKARLERELRQKAAQMVISIAKWAEVKTMRDRIVVTFKQE